MFRPFLFFIVFFLPVEQDQELLSVVTEVKREDSLYEPVSPTPLPDSPVDEVRGGGHQQEASDKKQLLSPQLSGDDGFTETKGRKVFLSSVASFSIHCFCIYDHQCCGSRFQIQNIWIRIQIMFWIRAVSNGYIINFGKKLLQNTVIKYCYKRLYSRTINSWKTVKKLMARENVTS